MGILSGVGPGLSGLFGKADLGDGIAQAQAYLDGDYLSGAKIAAARFRRQRQAQPAPGTVVDGYRFKGGDAKAAGSWEPAAAVGAGMPIPLDFGAWR
ncbi:MAG: hypothetical protein QOH81_968 [Sphingomonadales bacterium]|jgi:hypothetical protein|nr:hypothetical protein [Sphingomonadales bacterium]